MAGRARMASSMAMAVLASLVVLAPCEAAPATVFVDVSVVPMSRETVLPRRTVIVRDGRIVAIGESRRLKPPAGARIIDGRGRYLMPGLADMHAHLSMIDPRDALFLFLANGVTTVRIMAGNPRMLRLRGEIEAGSVAGPRLFVASPMLVQRVRLPGSSVQAADAAEAAQRVREAKDAGYDFIKTHQPITPEAYLAAIAEGRRLGIPVLGHVSPEVGVARSIEAGYATGEHFKGYDPRGPDPVLERLSVESGFRNCPTLVAMWTNAQQDALLADPLPEMRYLPPRSARGNADFRRRKEADEVDVPGYQRLLKRLDDRGARLLTGTDTGIFAVVPGFSLHREFGLWAEAGLSPYRVLRASTVEPAVFLGPHADSGVVEVGRRADLLLLDADPLADVANARKIAGVMTAGRYLDRAELDRGLADIEARTAAGDPRKVVGGAP